MSQELVDEEIELHECAMCAITQPVPFEDKDICDVCHENLQQAYKWLQSKMISSSEYKELQDTIFKLTDIDNVEFN